MANFEVIIPWLLYQEDSKKTPGLIKDLHDGNGLTRLGITQKWFASVVPPEFFTTMPFAEAVLVAREFYRNQEWHHINGDKISDDAVAAYLLSFSVNKSVPTAVKILQGVLGIQEDGVLGLGTLSELNSKDPRQVANLFRAGWISYYQHIAAVNPNDTQFLEGWINRANFPFPSALVPSIYE